jgi:hypothetical protein
MIALQLQAVRAAFEHAEPQQRANFKSKRTTVLVWQIIQCSKCAASESVIRRNGAQSRANLVRINLTRGLR